jgi:hypothetical protein
MAQPQLSSPCQLHKDYRLNTSLLEECDILIHGCDEDLVDEEERATRGADGKPVWKETTVALVCEACYKLGHFAYTESLKTSLWDKLLVSVY